MKNPTDVEIRVRDAKPEDLSVSDLADLMKAAEEAILGAIPAHAGLADTVASPEHVELPAVRVSLVRISRRSVGLHFASPEPRIVRPAFAEVASAVGRASILPLPLRSREGVRKLEEFSRRSGKVLEFRLPEQGRRTRTIATIFPDSDLFSYTADLVESATELYGRVERVGGATPKVVLRIAERVTLHCDVSEEIAKDLGRRLYSWVGVAGKARRNPFDHTIESFRIERVLAYQDLPITEAVAKLKALIGEHWAGVDALEEVAAFRRGEDE